MAVSIGHREERARLRAIVGEVPRGRGGVVLVEGEAGIGKSHLVRETVEWARSSVLGVQVLAGRADELERHRPFGAVLECFGIPRRGPAGPGPDGADPRDVVARVLAGELPDGAGVPVFPETPLLEYRVLEALAGLFEERCAEGPVVVVVEDVQWADPSSLLALHRMARETADLPAVLIGTRRPTPVSDDLRKLLSELADRGSERIALGPLSPEEVRGLVEELAGARPGARLLRQVASAGGNPLYVTELVRALERQGTLTRRPGAGGRVAEVESGPDGALPDSVQLAILNRLRFLRDEEIDVLRTASILGSDFAVADLSTVLGTSAASLTPALLGSARAGILVDRGARLAFRHDLIREVLYQDIPLPVRVGLHLEAGRALAAAGAPLEQVAEHLMRGASSGEPQAIAWLHDAARALAPRAPGVAVDILQRVLELAGPSGPGRDAMLADLAMSLMWSGRVLEAEGVCRAVLERVHDPATEGTLRLCLAQTLLAASRLEETLEEVDAAIASSALSEEERIRFWAYASTARWLSGDLAGAVDIAGTALARARDAGDDLATCISLSSLAIVALFTGRFDEALERSADAVRLADEGSAPEAHGFLLHLFRGAILMTVDRLDDALEALRHGQQVSEEVGARWNLPLYHWTLAIARYWAGDWDSALAELEAGLALSEQIGTRHRTVGHVVEAFIAFHRDDLERAERSVRLAEEEIAAWGAQFLIDWVLWARALLLESDGRAEEAFAMMSSAWELMAAVDFVTEMPLLAPDLVRLSLATGNRDRAEAVTEALRGVESTTVAPLRGAVARARGLLDGDPALLQAAVDVLRTSARPMDLALALEDAGEAVGRAGDVEGARARFDEAVEIYERLQASRDAARAQARARAVGIRQGRRGYRRRPRSGWASLTETEERVAALAAEGLSNPEIAGRMYISRRTVQSHVSHVLAKLGLRSRVELAAEAARRSSA
jgi:DNA-binding CsgD family transcriptional regulator